MLGYGDGMGKRVSGLGGPDLGHDGPRRASTCTRCSPHPRSASGCSSARPTSRGGGDPKVGGGGLLLRRICPADDGDLGDNGFGRRGIR
jgi:hypothetical protein